MTLRVGVVMRAVVVAILIVGLSIASRSSSAASRTEGGTSLSYAQEQAAEAHDYGSPATSTTPTANTRPGGALGRGVAQLTDGDTGGALASLGIAGFEIGPGGKARLLGGKLLAACRKALGRGAKAANAADDAYDIAAAGGKHAGFLKNYVGRSHRNLAGVCAR